MKKTALYNSVSALALTVSLVSGLAGFAAPFTDTSNHWAQADIEALSQMNVIGGYPDGSFHPEAPVTRAEFSAMMVKALRLQPNVGYGGFNDVPVSHWAYSAVETLKNNNLLNGYPGNVFMPNKQITRAEAMAVIAKASQGVGASNGSTAVLNGYADAVQVPGWAQQAVADTMNKGIYENRPVAGNTIEPNRSATRAEIAAMLNNLMALSNTTSPIATPNQPVPMAQNPYMQPAAVPPQQPVYTPGALAATIVAVPAQTIIQTTLVNPIDSGLNRVGEQVRLTVSQPVVSTQGQVTIPSGSQVVGTISDIRAEGRMNRGAEMAIDFNQVILPNGEMMPIKGSVNTKEGVLEANTTKGRALKAAGLTAGGAAAGAALGTAMGPLSGGKVGRGAIYGTAIGAGLGAAAALGDKGKQIELQAGTPLEIKLDEAIMVSQ